ncbi:MAG: ABC transporter ATP-binding protein [Desulfurococcales archaeon]|nr:ABC transporter ATP-binding protein [Desulfurococcales archaeon]
MKGKVIEVIDLVKRYGKTIALKGVSFSVYKGELYGLLGPNGAGKTTTIKALCGALRITSGKVLVLGYNVRKKPIEVKKRVGVVPETPSLFPELTLYENLYFIARLYGLSRDYAKRRIREISCTLDLERLLNTRYGRLSKGLKRRADIAAALIHDPEILLLDEPTAGIDVLAASRIRGLIREFTRMGKTILLTSHNISEVMMLASKVSILINGEIVIEDSPEALRKAIGVKKTIEFTVQSLNRGFLARIKALSNNTVVVDKKVRVKVEKPIEVIEKILSIARETQVVIEDIYVEPILWEDVFKHYVEEYMPRKECKGCPLYDVCG